MKEETVNTLPPVENLCDPTLPIVKRFKTRNGHTRTETVIGYVAGLIFGDGQEWLFGKNDWEKLYKDKNDKTLMFPTIEKAITHAEKFIETRKKYPVFVRPYLYISYEAEL